MISPPPCTELGSHCRELRLTVSISDLRDDGPVLRDALGTWLLGHTERITFGTPYLRGQRVVADATVHVACRFLKTPSGRGETRRSDTPVTCAAHGFRGTVPPVSQPAERARLRLDDGAFVIMQDGRMAAAALKAATPPPRALPVVPADNPCAGAPCRTADNRRGAACCRDLTLDVVLPADELETEALLSARRSPYVCKTTRVDEDLVECEVISACGYLAPDDLRCTLHGLVRENGAPAKPSICSDWPEDQPETVYHRGCRLIPERRRTPQPLS